MDYKLDIKPALPSASALFYAGRHEDLVVAAAAPGRRFDKAADVPYVIGALAFRGRFSEAEHLHAKWDKRLSAAGRAGALAYLSIGLCRHSKYERGEALVRANSAAHASARAPLPRFFAQIGLGFFSFVRSDYAAAVLAAEAAAAAADDAAFAFGSFLAADILGHCYARTGRVHAGLAALERAIAYAKVCGDESNFADGARVAIACYSAQFGLAPAADLERLEHLVRTCKPQDTYTLASLYLEIGRQLSLRGRLADSFEALDQACRIIYAVGHRRHEATLNLRYAYGHLLAGAYHQALNQVASARRSLTPGVDTALICVANGLHQRVCDVLSLEAPELKGRTTPKLYPASRIAQRQAAVAATASEPDPLGQLLDQIAALPKPAAAAKAPADLSALTPRHLSVAREVMAQGFHGFLPQVLGLPPPGRYLCLGLLPAGLVTADAGEVRVVPRGVTPMISAFLRQLASGEGRRAELTKGLWNQTYKAQRHDGLLSNLASRVRTLLGDSAAWLQTTEVGYKIAGGVSVVVECGPVPRVLPLAADGPLPGAALRPDLRLNARQLRLVTEPESAALDVQIWGRRHQVSRVTAMRDLSELCALGWLVRVGKARATKYVRTTIHKGGLDEGMENQHGGA